MTVTQELSRAGREALRLQFFRAFRGRGCVSASVRRDQQSGRLFLSVGVTPGADGRIPTVYGGLPVRRYPAPVAAHALRYGD